PARRKPVPPGSRAPVAARSQPNIDQRQSVAPSRAEESSAQRPIDRRTPAGNESQGRRRKSRGRPTISQVRRKTGAQKRTRTSTPFRAPPPEDGASTNSAIWARGRARPLGPALVGCQGEELADRLALRAARPLVLIRSHSANPEGSDAISPPLDCNQSRRWRWQPRSMKVEDEFHRIALLDPFRAANGDLDGHEPGFATLLREHRGVPGAGTD